MPSYSGSYNVCAMMCVGDRMVSPYYAGIKAVPGTGLAKTNCVESPL